MILRRFQLISTRSRRVRIHLLLQNHACSFKETRETHLQQRLVRLRNFSNVSGNSFPDCFSLLHHLGGCESTQDINNGKAVHSICIKTGFHRLPYVQNNIMRFYGNCDNLIKARQLFDEMSEPNLVSWTCMISLYVRKGQYDVALCMFSDMCRLGLRPNEFGFSVAIKACRVKGDIVMGELIYGLIMKCGFELDEFCSSSILGLFSDLGESESARKFFDGVPSWRRSEALWNTLLNSYAEGSDAKGVVMLFGQMMHSGTLPSCFTFAIVAKLCATILCLNLTSIFQCQIIKFGFQSHLVVGGALVNAYAKLRLLNSACEVFRNLEEKDNTVWCSLMAGFHLVGVAEGGLNCYLEFLSEGHKPDPFTFATVLSLCSGSETRNFDSQLHCSFFKYGFILDSFLGSAFIDMYGSKGFVSEAYKCFLEVKEKSEVCFGAMIKIFVSYSYNNKALQLFCYMKKLGYLPSLSILCHVLKACSTLSLFEKGRSLHGQIIQFPGAPDKLTAENVLIEMYAKCGAVDEAENVFRNIKVPNEFSWTAIMIACNESWQFGRSLQLFYEMFLSPVPVKPSPFAMVTALQACEMLKSLGKGKQLHAYCIKGGLESQSFVGSSLINMYAADKSEIRSAFQVFGSMSEHDIVSWCTMMSVSARNGHETEALSLFAELYNASIFSIDEVILSTCLSACAGLSALEKGKWFHAYILKSGFMLHEHVNSSVIDMYSKSGSIDGARKINSIEMRNKMKEETVCKKPGHSWVQIKVCKVCSRPMCWLDGIIAVASFTMQSSENNPAFWIK
ncbi:Pentatricopeptide repeat [Dillenia turbinata]|uniref:Pentatricopeptide repeat n=1 Tax=Dillenia turbinata TaxID=194707 RepID=A0AAN8ZEE9_9MAGN